MIYHFFADRSGFPLVTLLILCSFAAAFAGFKIFAKALPRDQGREFAVNGQLSQGKPRGAGIILVSVFVLCAALFTPMTVENVIDLALIYAAMITGFLDDASKVPWGELKKGLLDLVISAGLAVNFIWHNPANVIFFGNTFEMPKVIYVILAVGLIWLSINVVNCTDGVDGLCGSLSMVTIFLFMQSASGTQLFFGSRVGSEIYTESLVMLSVLAAYLWFNCSPSLILMGDAGSRALGVFIALLAMRTGHPFAFLLFAVVMLLDGGLGLVKLSVRRLLHSTTFMDGIRTPLHDHARKLKGWSDTQVVIRFVIIQLAVGYAALALINL